MQYTHRMLVILAIKRQYDFFPREIKQKIFSRVTCDALHNRATFCNGIMLVNYSQVLHRSVNCFSDYKAYWTRFLQPKLVHGTFTSTRAWKTKNRHYINRYILVIPIFFYLFFIKPLTVFIRRLFLRVLHIFHFQGEPRFCKPYRAIGSIKRTLAMLFPPVRWGTTKRNPVTCTYSIFSIN